MKKTIVLYNPSSGKGRSIQLKSTILSYLQKNGTEFDLTVTRSEAHLRESAAAAIHRYNTIVGVGGDTTFNIIVGQILENNASPTVGMIGTGSANDIIHGLGMNSIESACRAIAAGKTEKMDVGRAIIIEQSREIFFTGTLSLGLGTTVNRYVENYLVRRGKPLTGFRQTLAGLGGIRHSFKTAAVPLQLEVNGQSCRCSLLVILNTPLYAGGMKLSPHASPFDGRLDCCILDSHSFLHTLRMGLTASRNKHLHCSEWRIFQSESVKITSPGIDIQVDGELVENVKTLEVSSIPARLNVIQAVSENEHS